MFVTRRLENPVENNWSGSPKKTTLLNKLLQAFNKREANAKEFNEAIFFITLIVIVHSLSGVASCICFNTPFGVKFFLCLLNLAMLLAEVCLLKVFTKPTDIILDGNQSSLSISKNKPIFIAYAEPARNPIFSVQFINDQQHTRRVDALTAVCKLLLRENTLTDYSFSEDDLKKKLNNYFTAHRKLFTPSAPNRTVTESAVECMIEKYSAAGVCNMIKCFIIRLLSDQYCDIKRQIVDGDCSKIKVEYKHIMSSAVDTIKAKHRSSYSNNIRIIDEKYEELFNAVVKADHITQSKLLSEMLNIQTRNLSCASFFYEDFKVLYSVIISHFDEVRCVTQPRST